MRILAIGECMVELAPSATPGQFGLGFAGDTFNTAWYLARIAPDVSVSYFTAIGSDAISRNMKAFIAGAGIDDDHIREIADRTVGLYLISLKDGERVFTYWRDKSAARQLADDRPALEAAMDSADLVYFSGITLAILPPGGRKTLLDCARSARARNKTVVFDPNLRPGLWSSSSEMTDVIMQGASVSDLVLPSFEDEADWFGDATPEDTLARYDAAGSPTVVVKNGGGTVHFQHLGQRGTHDVVPLKQVVDTTAAGDSFNAGVISGFVADAPIAQCIASACDVAGKVVQGRGALVPI